MDSLKDLPLHEREFGCGCRVRIIKINSLIINECRSHKGQWIVLKNPDKNLKLN